MDDEAETYLARFRVKELQNVLRQLGQQTTGYKSQLVTRVRDYFDKHRSSAQAKLAKDIIRGTYQNLVHPPPPAELHSSRSAPSDSRDPGAMFDLPGLPGTLAHVASLPPSNGRVPHPSGHTPASVPYHNHPHPAGPPANGTTQLPHSAAAGQRGSGSGARRPIQFPDAIAGAGARVDQLAAAALAGSGPAGGGYGRWSGNLVMPMGLSAPSTAAGTVRCACPDRSRRDPALMVQCKYCHCWQHAACWHYPLPVDQATRRGHMCEMCRVDFSDPFWATADEGWIQALTFMRRPPGASNNSLHWQAQVQLFSANDMARLHLAKNSTQHQVQLVCISTADSSAFPNRLNFGRDAEAHVNEVKLVPRRANTKALLGANSHDDPLNITMCVSSRFAKSTTMAVSVTSRFEEKDRGGYLVGIRFAEARSVQGVEALMRPPESLGAASERVAHVVRRWCCIGGGDDVEVADVMGVNLKCPFSGARVADPARFVSPDSLAFFDWSNYMSLVQRNKKWQCPCKMRNGVTVRELQRDVYMAKVLALLKRRPEVAEIEVNAEGQWRPRKDATWRNIQDDVEPDPPARGVEAEDLGSEDDEDGGGRAQCAPRAVKTEPAAMGASGAPPVAAAAAADASVIDLTSDDEAVGGAAAQATRPPPLVWTGGPAAGPSRVGNDAEAADPRKTKRMRVAVNGVALDRSGRPLPGAAAAPPCGGSAQNGTDPLLMLPHDVFDPYRPRDAGRQ